MKVHNASRRMLDCYVALLEGFYPVDSPNGPVLVPEGMVDESWQWRADVKFDSFVASVTRDYASGLAVLSRYGFLLKSSSPDALEHCIVELLRSKFGEDLPPIRGMPKAMRRKKKIKKDLHGKK